MISKAYGDTTDDKTGNYQVANVNVRNLPDEVHRAIRIQAAL
ncbi:FitA-like ribbon-helix-helix domain-containing protein, partial [Pseudomonas savastanoi]